jgi:metacaspase-1
MKEYLMEVHGFEAENITVLMDDDDEDTADPTYENILAAYDKLVSETQEGDVVFCHFSGEYSIWVFRLCKETLSGPVQSFLT